MSASGLWSQGRICPRQRPWLIVRAPANLRPTIIASPVCLVVLKQLSVANRAIAQIGALIGRGLAAVFVALLEAWVFSQGGIAARAARKRANGK